MFTEGFDQYTELKNVISERDNLRDIKQKISQGKDYLLKDGLMKGLILQNSQYDHLCG